ncbi:MAG: hypothetical protein AAGH88_09250 [Planctomycetota bacterium]
MTRQAMPICIDTHVHLYPRFDLAKTLDAAVTNMQRDATAQPPAPCLMLTETISDNRFLALRDGEAVPGWRIAPSDEAALLLTREDGATLRLFAGGQTNTAERVEVLTLGTTQRLDDGQPLDATIDQAIETGGVVVLPFGLGKWFGRRAQLIAQAFEKYHGRGLRLGDNAGRPRGTGTPALFKRSERLGHAVLPGSDPLNTALGQTAAGRFSMTLNASFDPALPTESIRRVLREAPHPARTLGRRVSLVRCVREQCLLRIEKRRAR